MEINFEQTLDIAGTVMSKAEEVRALESWLNSCVESTLPNAWKGEGYEGYVDRVRSLKPSFDAMYEIITEMGAGLKQNAIDYQEFDKAKKLQNSK